MISVIIPVYNVEDYLHVCLNSILKQTYHDFEVICIDDASTDSSAEILEYFANKDSRIKILKNNYNKGSGVSRNNGLEVATGDYISFLDADDWLSPNAFEVLIKKLKKDHSELSLFKNILYYDDNHEFRMESYYDMEFMNGFESKVFNHEDLDKSFLFNMPVESNNAIYLKSFLDNNNIRFSNENFINGDCLFFYKVLTSAKKVSFVNSYLYNRRKKSDTLMSPNYDLFECIRFIYPLISFFLSNKNLFNYYKKEILNYIFIDVLLDKYHQLNDKFKEKLFDEIQLIYRSFIKDYGLYKDIKETIDKDILLLFRVDDIVNELINYIPKISVVIPFYNVENYLNQSLNSVINQKFRDIEIICINNNSTDNSLNILESYAQKDNRIKVINNQKNYGIAYSRNIGLKNATGDYVLFIDSDDFLVKDCLQELYLNAISNNSDLVQFKFNKYDEIDDTFVKSGVPLDSLFGEIDYDNFTFTYKDMKNHVMNTFIAVWSKLFKKEFLDKSNLYFQENLAYEDILFQIKSFLYADSISFLPKCIYNYRTSNPNSIMHDKSRMEGIIATVDSIEEFLISSGFYDEFKQEFSLFKITQLSQYIISLNSNNYYTEVKNKFEALANSQGSDFDYLPDHLKQIFDKVLYSNNIEEFKSK